MCLFTSSLLVTLLAANGPLAEPKEPEPPHQEVERAEYSGMVYVLSPDARDHVEPIPTEVGPRGPEEGIVRIDLDSWLMIRIEGVQPRDLEKAMVRVEPAGVVTVVPGSFRGGVRLLMAGGQTPMPAIGSVDPIVLLQAKSPGEATVFVRVGSKTFTYDIQVSGDFLEAPDIP